jgi:hypothetical protein
VGRHEGGLSLSTYVLHLLRPEPEGGTMLPETQQLDLG